MALSERLKGVKRGVSLVHELTTTGRKSGLLAGPEPANPYRRSALSSRRILLAVAAGSFFCWPNATRAANEVADQLISKVVMRVLAYDSTIAPSAGSAFKLAILYQGAEPSITKELQKFAGHEIQTLPIEVTTLEYKNIGQLRVALKSDGIDAVFVSEDLSAVVSAIVGVCRENQVRSVAPTEEMAKAGIAIAVVLRDGKPKIIVNLTGAKAEGMRLSARVLGLSEIIR